MYGAVADWCEVLAQQIPAQASFSIEKSIAKVTEQLNRPLAPEDVNTMMKPVETEVPASRNRLRDHHEKFENVSKEIKVTQTCEIAGCLLLDNASEQSTTLMMVWRKTAACREYTLPRDHDDCEPVGWIRGFAMIGPVIQVRVTYYAEQYGIEIQVKSMLNNGPLSWISQSRRPNKYVHEIYEEKEVPSYDEGLASGTRIEKSIAYRQ